MAAEDFEVDQTNISYAAEKLSIESEQPGETRIAPATIIEQCVRFSNNLIVVKRMGSFSYLGAESWVANTNQIGRYCSIGQGVMIGAGPHPTNWLSTSTFFYRRAMWKTHPLVEAFYRDHPVDYQFEQAPCSIGNDVWIGSKSVVLMGVVIGDGAIIGANSTVTKDVPPYAVVAGSPAKIIRFRFPEDVVQRFGKNQWWNIDPLKLKGLEYANVERCLDAIEHLNGVGGAAYEPQTMMTRDWVTL